MIKEVIVVEGRDDIRAVKDAIDAEVIATGGFGYDERFINKLKTIANKRGIIILTDPDYAGEKIRKDINKYINNCKHAFLPRGKAIKKGDIGVENAARKDIIESIERARPVITDKRAEFTNEDLLGLGLMGNHNSQNRRMMLGDILGIGYGNSKQFINRLNNFGITKEELISALRMMSEHEQ